MMIHIRSVDGEFPVLREEARDDAPGPMLPVGREAEVLEDEAGGDWVRIRIALPGAGLKEGWLLRAFLGEPAQPPKISLDIKNFTRACAFEELGATTGGTDGETPDLAVTADYLLALALIESGLEHFDADDPGPEGVGPYRFGVARWRSEAMPPPLALPASRRYYPFHQVRAAALVTRRHWATLSTQATPEPEPADGPTVPSFLDLLHAWMLGPEAAIEVDSRLQDEDASGSISDLVRRHHDAATADGILRDRARFVSPNDTDGSIAEFADLTRAALREAFESAFSLLKTHFPDFVAPPEGSAPWMEVAERELKFWGGDRSGARPSDAEGPGLEKLNTYFRATDFNNNNRRAPWCGAFTAHCLRESGGRAADSVIRGAARAANWKTWGDIELHGRNAEALRRGAVVVTKALAPGASGHVGFATGEVSGTRFELLGGNQSRSVTRQRYTLDSIVSIRWLGPKDDAVAALSEVDDDALTLARTLYGEARGEGRAGMEAVASVIMNRVRSARYPGSVAGVCLQRFQFSCWNPNDPNRKKIVNLNAGQDNAFDACLNVARRALAAQIVDPTGGALHYHATSISPPKWVLASPNHVVTARIGGHIFYTGIT
jgi:uncharacterized protein (TIGR02594 family)